MKNKQLLIVSLLAAFCGVNATSEQPGLNKLAALGAYWSNGTKGSLVYQNCEKNFTQDCTVLADMISLAQDHLRKVSDIRQTEAAFSNAYNSFAKEALGGKLAQQKKDYPQHDKTFEESLSKNDKEQLRKSVATLLSALPVDKVDNEGHSITYVLSELLTKK